MFVDSHKVLPHHVNPVEASRNITINHFDARFLRVKQ